jgi:hypothetical protein
MSAKWGMFAPLFLCLSACATVPTGPNVLVLPGAGKPFAQFQADDLICQQFAQGQVGSTPGQASMQSSVQGSAIGTALGAATGAAIGAAAGNPGVGAAVGGGTGILIGTAAGAGIGSTAAGTLQWRYDVAYMQCMYAKGNQLPGVTTAASSYQSPLPNAQPPLGVTAPSPPAISPPP